MTILKDLAREDLTSAEIKRRLRSAAGKRERAERMKDEADREIAEVTAVARARDLVSLQEMTEIIGESREFVAWLQRKYSVTQKHLKALVRNGRKP